MTEKGFYVEPKKDCPHIKNSFIANINNVASNKTCTDCSNEEENWCCLTCEKRFCSRYVEGHMEQHFHKENHPICVSYSDFSFWCYKCDSYITTKAFKPLLSLLAEEKFGNEGSNDSKTYFEEWTSAHGHKGQLDWPLPSLVTKCNEFARKDQKNTIKANEFLDSDEVLEAKMELIANMIKESKFLITYTGAGLSKASGIPDYATKSENSVVNGPKLLSPLEAAPTFSHYILKRLADKGYLKYWVQQNHDGLPQKAGFPQEKINEIHGAWFDPSNPVVQFSGNLRSDLFQEMIEIEDKADMCLCLGTSLSGMNADRMAVTPAKKFMKSKNQLGTIIINIQQTPLDGSTSVRVWAKLDDAFRILAQKLDIDCSIPPYPLPELPIGNGDSFIIPYDAKGNYDPNSRMKLRLHEGAKIIIPNPNASNYKAVGIVYGRRPDKCWTVSLVMERTYHFAFGWWWIEAAQRGAIPSIPFVNNPPKMLTSDNSVDHGDDDDDIEDVKGENEEKKEGCSVM